MYLRVIKGTITAIEASVIDVVKSLLGLAFFFFRVPVKYSIHISLFQLT
jgi:hypothetical protein